MLSLPCPRLVQLHWTGLLPFWNARSPSAGPLLELKAPAPALLSALPVAMVPWSFLRRICLGLYLVDQRLLMKLGLRTACWDIFLCMWSVAVGSADRGERSCGLFPQVIEVTLCVFKEALPNPRLSFPFAPSPARERCCDLHVELYPARVKSWISSHVRSEKGSSKGFWIPTCFCSHWSPVNCNFCLLWKLLFLVNNSTLQDFSSTRLSDASFLFWCNRCFIPFYHS